MDIAYLQLRERISRRLSVTSPSRSARAAHRAFAIAYAKVLAELAQRSASAGRPPAARSNQAG